MGDEISAIRYSAEERQRYREKVDLCLDVFERLLATWTFDDDRPMTGLEMELNLVGGDFRPTLRNTAVLENIGDPNFQTELGAYNIELNVEPAPLSELARLETRLRDVLNHAEQAANARDAHIVMVGILPTTMPEHLNDPEWMTASARYKALNDSILAARGENLHLDIHGAERLSTFASSLAPESACTSVQLHVQVQPERFASAWNAAQVLAGPQLAIGANSPFFFGRRLWAETRIELFKQATDTRPQELQNQGVRPRVWFGEKWISSIFDLFAENGWYFPSLLPEMSEEDPVAVLDAGRAPTLQELRLHNGTVYRWNRPIYAVVDGEPHVRVENRVLPAGPTVVDTVANAAFFHGALRSLMDDQRPAWSKMSFAAAEDNFLACAKDGLDAQVYSPQLGQTGAEELILRRLLPMAVQGLQSAGVPSDDLDRYLGIVEGRVKTGMNGAAWQVAAVERLEQGTAGRPGLDRAEALRTMTELYCEGMHANEPVHTWSLP
ncbi:glutamate-cysteine ligase family protein [Kineosporia succinea]|uniref:Gamma-glutamyl:cysteine ligase YbdK (ATP-grasp superfamily) n=1 Tax=Kineosporia succinea TaxID=84632 RepID=A0ABT9P741_9ACTN|nr:glutamate-cysteine ligase family protein [Kineosporia succinea]MDP9828535.1 gamma-glutamyl:cysteine ligase YbdK (ATP-grasp superfamily) [Kineosporia succinea]